MANYLAMNREELAAEKAALEAEYKKFQDTGNQATRFVVQGKRVNAVNPQ